MKAEHYKLAISCFSKQSMACRETRLPTLVVACRVMDQAATKPSLTRTKRCGSAIAGAPAVASPVARGWNSQLGPPASYCDGAPSGRIATSSSAALPSKASSSSVHLVVRPRLLALRPGHDRSSYGRRDRRRRNHPTRWSRPRGPTRKRRPRRLGREQPPNPLCQSHATIPNVRLPISAAPAFSKMRGNFGKTASTRPMRFIRRAEHHLVSRNLPCAKSSSACQSGLIRCAIGTRSSRAVKPRQK